MEKSISLDRGLMARSTAGMVSLVQMAQLAVPHHPDGDVVQFPMLPAALMKFIAVLQNIPSVI